MVCGGQRSFLPRQINQLKHIQKKTKSLLHTYQLSKTIHLNGSFVGPMIFFFYFLTMVYLLHSRQVVRFCEPPFFEFAHFDCYEDLFSLTISMPLNIILDIIGLNDFIYLHRRFRFRCQTPDKEKRFHFFRFSFETFLILPVFVRGALCGFCYCRASFFGTRVYSILIYVLDTMTNHAIDFDISNFISSFRFHCLLDAKIPPSFFIPYVGSVE